MGKDPSIDVYLPTQDSSFLLYVPDQPENDVVSTMQNCVGDIREVQSIFLWHGLPLRGGMSFGDVVYSELGLMGEPINKATSYEKLIPSPAVVLPYLECAQLQQKGHWHIPSMFPYVSELTLNDGFPIAGSLVYPQEICAFLRKKYNDYLLNGQSKQAMIYQKALSFIDDYERQGAVDGRA